MKLRSIASPLTIASFIVVATTGLCLFFGYRGGLVDPIHEIASLLFVLGCVLHIVVNWKPVVLHIKRPLGAILTGVFLLITVIAVVPHDDAAGGGNPVRKSVALLLDADLSVLAALTKKSEAVLQERLKRLEISAAPGVSLRQMASASHKNPMAALSVLLAE